MSMEEKSHPAASDPNQDDTVGSAEPSAAQLAKIQQDYEAARSKNKSLLDEVVFILTERLRTSDIKVHAIEHRIKTLDSILGKCRRDSVSSFDELDDVVGARVVCLFRSDLDRVGQLVGENFEVIEVDDKLSGENSPLGYLSVHYSCKMPSSYRGPRYENTADLVFEIQVRTLCMHAWAAVSHYLDYKGDWDVPAELKRALGALSGLFYVADNEFEQFYAARITSRERAERGEEGVTTKEINLDTVSAFLTSKFPNRKVAAGQGEFDSTDVVSQFVREIKLAGYKSMDEVDREIDRGWEGLVQYEAIGPLSKNHFTAVGAARIALGIASEKFYAVSARRRRYLMVKGGDPILRFRHLVRGEGTSS
jgi:putative GTP pyrophosphokinase